MASMTPSGREDAARFTFRDTLPARVTLNRALPELRDAEVLTEALGDRVDQVTLGRHQRARGHERRRACLLQVRREVLVGVTREHERGSPFGGVRFGLR